MMKIERIGIYVFSRLRRFRIKLKCRIDTGFECSLVLLNPVS